MCGSNTRAGMGSSGAHRASGLRGVGVPHRLYPSNFAIECSQSDIPTQDWASRARVGGQAVGAWLAGYSHGRILGGGGGVGAVD